MEYIELRKKLKEDVERNTNIAAILEKLNTEDPEIDYVLSQVNKEDLIKYLSSEFSYKDNGHLHNIVSLFNDDIDYVLPIVKENGEAIRRVSDRLKHNKEIALAAVQDNGFSLEHLPEEFQNDEDIVFEAVKDAGRALKYAGAKLKNNEKIATAAMDNDPLSIVYVANKFQKNKDYYIKAIQKINELDQTKKGKKGRVYIGSDVFKQNISRKLHELIGYYKNDLDVAMEMAKAKVSVFDDIYHYFSRKIQQNEDFVRTLVENHPYAYETLPIWYRSKMDIATKAVKNGYDAILLEPELYKNNKSLIIMSVQNNGLRLEEYTKYQNDREVVVEAIKENGLALQYASKPFKKDKDIIKIAINNIAQAYALAIIDDNDVDFIFELLNINPFVINYMPYDLQRSFVDYYKTVFTDKNSKLYVDTEYRYISSIIEDISYSLCEFDKNFEIGKIIIQNFIKNYKLKHEKEEKTVENINPLYLEMVEQIYMQTHEHDKKTIPDEEKSFFQRVVKCSDKRWKHPKNNGISFM